MQYNPFISQWVALLKDGTVREHNLNNMEVPFLEKMDMSQVSSFWYVNSLGNRIFGVDIKKQIFLINGCLVKLPLPKGDYEAIALMRTLVETGHEDNPIRLFAFGMKGIDIEHSKRLFIIYPDGSVLMEE